VNYWSHVPTRGSSALNIGPCAPTVTKSNCGLRHYCAYTSGRHSFTQPISFLFVFGIFCNYFTLDSLYGFEIMRRSPRLRQVNDMSSAGPRSAAAPASVPPSTPRKGEALTNLIRSLEEQWQLGFKLLPEYRSPARNKSAVDNVAKDIQYLYYSARPALDDALEMFATMAAFIEQDQRLNVLSKILRHKTQQQSPISRKGTPLSARKVPPKSPHLPQPCKYECERCSFLYMITRCLSFIHSFIYLFNC
jgi:hypothetical protein